MKFLVFAVIALAVVHAQRGTTRRSATTSTPTTPETLCTPNRYETDVYDFNLTLSGQHAVDWVLNKSVVKFSNGVRIIYDMTTMRGYMILPNGNCSLIPVHPISLTVRCITANAVNRFNQIQRIGPLGSNGINFKSYDFYITQTSKVRTYFTDSNPVYPIFREIIGAGPHVKGKLILFTNPRSTPMASPLLHIPHNCPY